MPIRRSKFLKRDGPTSRLSGDCGVSGCKRPMFRKGLCCAHFKRKQRNKPVDGLIGEARVEGGLELAEVLDPMERALEASGAWAEELTKRALLSSAQWADAPSEDDGLYRARRRDVMKAFEQLFISRGWRPPSSRPQARLRRA